MAPLNKETGKEHGTPQQRNRQRTWHPSTQETGKEHVILQTRVIHIYVLFLEQVV